MRLVDVSLGMSLGMILFGACASTMEYHYYGLVMPDECYDKGQMLGKLGKEGWADLPFAECKPGAGANEKGKCVVELSHDHFAKEQALEECQAALKQCQAGPAPVPSSVSSF